MHETTYELETAVLVAIDTGEYDVEQSLAELEELAATAGIDCLGSVVQARSDPDKATFVGSGKLEEVAEFIKSSGAELLIFDHELSATQLRNIEAACEIAVIDRTMLILEIFAQRAQSREGKLQVELAQHKYLLPRLSGMGKSLSRLGGGGGGAGAGARRGKGETKLELDRRHIRRRIQSLEESLEKLEHRRGLARDRRRKDGVIVATIVGYTNVGKSTLLNTLTDAGVLAENKLFATLDPTARVLELPDGREIMLIDTVGLVRRLPHHLVEAFKSTLEEAVCADILLNVCDISSNEAPEQIEVTEQLLVELGVSGTPILNVMNKCDLVQTVPLAMGDANVIISAETGAGLTELLEKIAKLLEPTQMRRKLLIPYEMGALIAQIREEGKVLAQEFTESGTLVDALVDRKLLQATEKYMQA